MSKKPKVPKRIRRGFAKEILEADRMPPENTFNDIEEMLNWLDDTATGENSDEKASEGD